MGMIIVILDFPRSPHYHKRSSGHDAEAAMTVRRPHLQDRHGIMNMLASPAVSPLWYVMPSLETTVKATGILF